MRGHGGLHGRVKKSDRVATGCLGLVHRHIGLFEQGFGVVVFAGKQHNSNAGRALERVATQLVGLTQGAQDFAGNGFGLGRAFV